MKKFLKTLLISIGVMIVIFGSLFYLMFYGLPWKKLETKKVVVKYLKNQYNQEMIIDGIGYNFKSGYYYAEAHTKEPPSINFEVSIDGNGKITDYYRFELWKNQMTEDIKPFLNKLYPNMLKFELGVGPQGELYFAPKSDIPNYKSFASQSSLTIWVNVVPAFSIENEYQKIFELLKYTREHQNKLISLTIYYNDQEKLKSTIEFDEKDLESVQSWQDVERLIKKGPPWYTPQPP